MIVVQKEVWWNMQLHAARVTGPTMAWDGMAGL